MEILKLTRTVKTAKRLRQIVNVFLRHGFGQIIDQIHLGRYVPFRRRIKPVRQWPSLKGPSAGERLRMAFAELGPSFIKLAQLLSSRPDLVTVEIADELKKLQDEVPPFPTSEAREIVEREAGMPIEKIFSSFTDTPVAAASIAQVHHATLIDGKEVVVKVQRPDIAAQIETDIDIMGTVARLFEQYIAESRVFNPVGIVEEFARTVRKELNFTQEGRSCARIKRNFQDVPDIYIPAVYTEFLTEKVLVMEKIEGVRIDDIEGIEALGLDRKALAKAGVDAFFKMVLEDGFFHADPHPGNIFAMPSGQIGFMDFGIVGRVSEELKRLMADTLLSLITKDFDKLVDNYIEMGIVPGDRDLDAFRREFKADLTDFLEPFYGLTLKEIDFSHSVDALLRISIKHRLKVPSEQLLINKAMLMIENIGRRLDPDFDFMAASEPYAAKLATQKLTLSTFYKKVGQNLGETTDFVVMFPRQMKKLLRKVLSDDFHLKLTHIGLDHLIRDMDRSSNRIAFAVVVSSLILSSAIMHATGVGPKLYGMSVLGLMSFGFASLLGLWLIFSIIRSGRL